MKDAIMTGILGLAMVMPTLAAEPSRAVQNQRWEASLTSAKAAKHPYADVVLSVSYKGPEGRVLRTYGFWDGGLTFRIRAAFPTAGQWTWETQCSDPLDSGLHGRTGTVVVTPYTDTNPLYRHGMLKVSADKRYLVHDDGTPFLWIGDTAWVAGLKATAEDWAEYVSDRRKKRFALVQISPASEWGAATDRQNNKPFADADLRQWNPEYWRAFEAKIQHANENGLYVLLNGIMEPVSRYPKPETATLFARNIVARLYGNFVLFSPSFDSNERQVALGNAVGKALREATDVHLITQHPATSLKTTMEYYEQDYLDFVGVQTGHAGGRRDVVYAHALEWNLVAYNVENHKPVVNMEAFYDAAGTTDQLPAKFRGTALDARAVGYISLLTGAKGYTYGAYGLWNWQTDESHPYVWRKAMAFPSSMHMMHMHDFFAAIEWWKLEPASDVVKNAGRTPTDAIVLAKAATSDLAVAYTSNAERIDIDLSKLRVTHFQWHNPVTGLAEKTAAVTSGVFTKPSGWEDAVLLLWSPRAPVTPRDAAGN